MKTILIPLDSSEASKNALGYVAGLVKMIGADRIILLRSFYVSPYAQILPSADFVQISAEQIAEEKQTHRAEMQNMAAGLLAGISTSVKIDILLIDQPFLRAVNSTITAESCDLVVLGSSGETVIHDNYINGQIFAIARTSPVPVLVIPANAVYEPVRRALIPVDFSANGSLNALTALREIPFRHQPELMILNIDPHLSHVGHEDEHLGTLKAALEGYSYKMFYSEDPDTVLGILDFANQHLPQLLIALPGRHSFFYKLTHRSISEAVALNSRQPVLILK